ncbi:MAG: hypothetical protein WCK59_01105 [Candidatus Falkowbacteria bacterium]
MAEAKQNICKHCKESVARGATKCPHCQSDLRNFFVRHPLIVIFLLAILVPTIISALGENRSVTSQQAQKTQTQTPVDTSNIKYEIIKTWDIANGGTGREILIPVSYVNDKDMVALGEKLKSDFVDERNNFIWVFTDKKLSALRSKMMKADLSKSDQDFYDKHYVGQYNKNINSGMNRFVIYFDGVNGSNQKTINY